MINSHFRTTAEVLNAIEDTVEFGGISPVSVDSVGIFGSQPLKTVITWGDAFAVQLLLNSGAKIDAQHEDGNTALHHAIHMGHFDIARLLIEQCADQSIRNNEGKLARDYCWNAEWADLGLSDK